jgi:hypothetical protein
VGARFPHAFDANAEPSVNEEGQGLRTGVQRLWRRVLEEAVQDDGRPTFTDFSLRVGGRTLRVPRDPSRDLELARLRAWRRVVSVVPTLASVHSDAFRLDPALLMLALLREAPSAASLGDQLGPLRFVLPLALALSQAFRLEVELAQVKWLNAATLLYGCRSSEALGYAQGSRYDVGFSAFRLALEGCEVEGRSLNFALRLEDTDSRVEADGGDERAARLERAPEAAARG